MSQSTMSFTKGSNIEPKWLLASLGISAGKWSTLWNRMQSSSASLIFRLKFYLTMFQTKKGSSMFVNSEVNSIEPS